MSYRCNACERAVPHGVTRRVYVVRRQNGQIAREIPVCGACLASLEGGASLEEIVPVRLTSYRTPRPLPPVVPVRLFGRDAFRPKK